VEINCESLWNFAHFDLVFFFCYWEFFFLGWLIGYGERVIVEKVAAYYLPLPAKMDTQVFLNIIDFFGINTTQYFISVI
jgi:hypothetical protein